MEQKKKKPALSYIMEWAGQKKSLYIASVVLAVASAAAGILPYFRIGNIVNHLIEKNTDASVYGSDIILIVVWFLIAELCHTLSTSLSHKATFAVIGNVRMSLMKKIARMPLGRVIERGSGSLKNIMMERVDSIESTLAHLLPEVTSNVLVPVFIFIYLLAIDARMAFIALIPTALGIFSAIGLFSGYGKSYQKTVETGRALNDAAVEYVSGIEVIKAFSKTEGSYQKFVDAAEENAQSYATWMKRCAGYQAGTMTLIPYTLLSVLPFGAWFVSNNTLPLSDFIMCVILSLGLLAPLITLGSYSDDIAACGTIIEEISSILEEKEIERPDATEELPHDNSVELKHVTFAYKDKDVLHDINMRFEPGSVNAIAGPSGSGKSTIARLIAGYWDLEHGEIDYGGVNVKKISAEDFSRKIAYVSQDNYLFNESIRENIRMGRPDASDEEVEEIARKSGCYDFIMSLENGFGTIAGSSGGHLSGGERQRICIARAMLKDAPVIILDEATAYTDPESEAVVEQAIAKLVKGKTLIMIAHRLYTIETADCIWLINNGRVEDHGTQKELLERSALYQRMWKSHLSSRDSAQEEASC